MQLKTKEEIILTLKIVFKPYHAMMLRNLENIDRVSEQLKFFLLPPLFFYNFYCNFLVTGFVDTFAENRPWGAMANDLVKNLVTYYFLNLNGCFMVLSNRYFGVIELL